MKRILVAIILCLFVNQEMVETKGEALIDIADFIIDNGLVVDEWVVTMKEKITTQTDLDKIMHDLNASYKQTYNENKDTKIYFYDNGHNIDRMNVSFKVVIPKKNYPAELIATITGDHWYVSKANDYRKSIRTIIGKYYTENRHVYTCLSTEENAIIKSDVFLNKMVEKLRITNIMKQIDRLNDQTYKEIYYGYTQIWEEKLTIEDEPMNLQVVVAGRKSEKQKLIIGTPILINEY